MNDAQQAFGLGSLVQAVSEFADSDCNTLVTRLLMQVLEFQQGQVFDDITLMAIRREPT